VWPSYQYVYLNSSALIYCDSSKPATWFFQGYEVLRESNSLLIHTVTKRDGGTYICQGEITTGEKFYSKAEIKVGYHQVSTLKEVFIS